MSFDTLGHPSGPTYLDTIIVIASGISFQGKTNVILLRNSSDTSTHNKGAYWNYESNGDISVYEDAEGVPGNKSGWEVLPIASIGKTSFLKSDTVEFGQRFTNVDSNVYLRSENIIEAGETFNASVLWRATFDQDGHENWIETLWIAPSIGMIVKDRIDYTDRSSSSITYEVWDLISYTLK